MKMAADAIKPFAGIRAKRSHHSTQPKLFPKRIG